MRRSGRREVTEGEEGERMGKKVARGQRDAGEAARDQAGEGGREEGEREGTKAIQ